jgi:hypothetical protein
VNAITTWPPIGWNATSSASAFEGDSQVECFAGNYADYEADYKPRKGHDADRPHRLKYRKLTRD